MVAVIQKIKKLFAAPPATVLAAAELAEARRQLLEAETLAEHYRHRVTFLRGVIQRLNSYTEAVQ